MLNPYQRQRHPLHPAVRAARNIVNAFRNYGGITPARVAGAAVGAGILKRAASRMWSTPSPKRSFGNRAASSEMPRSGVVSTVQKDYGRLYSKRRSRRRFKRRFRKRMNAKAVYRIAKRVAFKSQILGAHRLNFTTIGQQTQTAGNQALLAFTLGGLTGAADDQTSIAGNRDVTEMHNELVNTGQMTVNDQGKFWIKNQIMDITLHNTGDTSIELDVYKVYYKQRDIEYANPIAMIGGLTTSTTTPGGIGTSTNATDLGWSLFSCPGVGRHMKIVNEERIYMEAGKCVTLVMKNKRSFGQQAENVFLFGTDFVGKRTCGYIIVIRGCPVEVAGPAWTTEAVQLAWHVNRRYIVSTNNPNQQYSQFIRT